MHVPPSGQRNFATPDMQQVELRLMIAVEYVNGVFGEISKEATIPLYQADFLYKPDPLATVVSQEAGVGYF
jgi:hypothetical protein